MPADLKRVFFCVVRFIANYTCYVRLPPTGGRRKLSRQRRSARSFSGPIELLTARTQSVVSRLNSWL
jgi:hypothetical protein